MNRNCLFICKRRNFVALFIVIVMCAASIHVMANNSVKAEGTVDEPVGEETVSELQKLEGKLTAENEASERNGLQEAVKERRTNPDTVVVEVSKRAGLWQKHIG